MSTPTDAHDVLVEARKKIEKPHNWVKGSFRRDFWRFNKETMEYERTPAYCSVGAIEAVTSDLNLRTQAVLALEKCVPLRLRNNQFNSAYYDVMEFNDADARQHEQVLAVFDCAIKKTEPKS